MSADASRVGEQLAIGVDIGGTKIAFALVSRAGQVLATHRLPTLPQEGAEAVFGRVADGVHYLLAQTDQPVGGVGIGCPGRLNPITGVIHGATNLNWLDVPLKAGVQARLQTDLPVWVLKDANAGALGELYFGAARGVADFVYLTLGTGLGGGAVAGGRLVQGGDFAAMEIGHMPFTPTGRRCACGMDGCPEMYASGIGLLAGVREYLPAYPTSALAALGAPVRTDDVLRAARAGDPLAERVVDEAAWWLASVMICLLGILSPTLFVVGGGLGHAAADLLLPQVRAMVQARTTPLVLPEVPIVESQVTSSAVGAACQVWFAAHTESER